MNEAFRQLFDQVKSGVVWVKRDGVVLYANKAAVQMTPVILGQGMLDPVALRTVKAGGQDMLNLPFQFELTTQEANPDTIHAVLINAPVGKDLMVVLNNVSQENWYEHALDNLVGYIEAEMAQPIMALTSKLPHIPELLHRPQAGQVLTELTEEANALSSKLNNLRDLVAVFGKSAIQRDERVMLPDLITKALNEVMPQATARNVSVSVQGLNADLPPVYGSVHWLAKALSEYMEQCIRSAQPADLIELSVQAVGTHIMVHARNQGRFVSNHERRSAFVPFGVGDSPKSTTRQGIGLALSQRILEQHGGSVRIQDEFDGVDFVLEIPAGAPATPNAQLLVEQAQRYARDMSQLLARSLNKRKPSAAATGTLPASGPSST